MFKVNDRVVSKYDQYEREIMVIDSISTSGGTWPNHCKFEGTGKFAGAWPDSDLVHANPLVTDMPVSDIAVELTPFVDSIKTTNLNHRTKELLLRLIELNTIN